jgi:pilus assembly protein Flp/PilA
MYFRSRNEPYYLILGEVSNCAELSPTFPLLDEEMRKLLNVFVRDDRGVSAMEYAVLAGIVVMALGAMATVFSTDIGTMFSTMFAKVVSAQA